MIVGVGVDIVKIERFKKKINNEKFMNKIFTLNEISFIGNNPSKASGNFALKEAIVKITGRGFAILNPRDIEILRDEFGAPKIILYNKAEKYFSERNIKLYGSISNTDDLVVAYAVGEI